MQFFWKYIDDLMGKGISMKVIIELLFYVSADLIPLALPLAILLSSIMTFGNLAENNELTALKSSGLSLYRIMRPLTSMVFFIAFVTLYFSNYVIPVATLKLHSLIYDIQQTKISAVITPGVFTNQIDGYAIKVDEGRNNHFKGILIHVHTDPTKIKTVRAKEGKIYKSIDGKHLFFELHDGYVTEELSPQSPTFRDDGEILKNISNSHPARRYSFTSATYKIDINGFKLSRSNEELFKNQHEMLNVFQIDDAIDSVQMEADKVMKNFTTSIKMDHTYYQARTYKPDTVNVQLKDFSGKNFLDKNLQGKNIQGNLNELSTAIPAIIDLKNLTKNERLAALSAIPPNLRRINQNLEGQSTYIAVLNQSMNLYYIEFHRKFALTFAIIVLFFIGAPLGAIVKKGGFGTPLVLAALLFMLYFILITVGQSLAESNFVNPFIGMWFATLVLSPIAFILMRAAANDSEIINKEFIANISTYFKRKK